MINNMKRRIIVLSLILLISSYFTIFTYGSANDSVLWLDKASYSGYGARPVITLQDDDLNANSKRRDEVSVMVSSTTDTVGITVKLIETVSNSGEFTADFGVGKTKSDNVLKVLQIVNNDTITVTYKDPNPTSDSAKTFTCNANWQANTGEVKLLRSSYTGLHSIAMVLVNDKDLDLRPGYIDTATVRIYSDADPRGIKLTAYETGSNTGTFAAYFGFDINRSDIGDAIIKVNPSDNIYAEYTDEINADGAVNFCVIATSSFKFSEAVIKTSAANDEGSGCILTVTIEEPDANNPNAKDRIIAKANSDNGSQGKTIWLDETGTNTGVFKCSLFLNDEITSANSLRVKPSDIISIKYIDNTVPQGGTSEVVKTVKWTYIGTLLKTDKKVYSGYSTSVKISLTDYTLNTDEEKVECIDVRATTSDSKGIKLELKETSANSGEFTGTLNLGKSSKASSGTLKVITNETITVAYTNPKDDDDFIECSFSWVFLDGQITLDRQEYKGIDAPVKVTLRDLDASDNPRIKDEIKVVVRSLGAEKPINVVLTETGSNTGTYTGTFYINGSGGNKPSITLPPAEKFEVVYVDEYNTIGKAVDRIASAVWGGISKATLTLDKQKYTGYGDIMLIILNDPDQNKSTSTRDKVTVAIRTKSGKTSAIYELTETSNNNDEFSAVIEFTEGPRTEKKICVAPDDIIYVDFAAKGVNAYATFTK